MKWLFDKFKNSGKRKPNTITFCFPDSLPDMPDGSPFDPNLVQHGTTAAEYVSVSPHGNVWNSIHPDERYTWVDFPKTYKKQKSKGFFANNPLAPLPEVLRRNGFEIEKKLLEHIGDEKYIYPLCIAMQSLSKTLPHWGVNLFDNMKDKVVEDINTGKCMFIITDVDDVNPLMVEEWVFPKLEILLTVAGIEPSKVMYVTRNPADRVIAELTTEIEVVTWDYFATAEKFRTEAQESYSVPIVPTTYNPELQKEYYNSLVEFVPNNKFVAKFKDNMKRLKIDPTFGGKIEIIYGNPSYGGYPKEILRGSHTYCFQLLHCFSQKKPFIYISDDNLVQSLGDKNYGAFFGWSLHYSEIENETRRLNELNQLFMELERNKDVLEETIYTSGKETLEGNFNSLSKAVPEIELIEQICNFHDVNYYADICPKS